jgi:hypothetical protein
MKETLEEAADNWVRQPIIGTKRESFIAGAKWQQEQTVITLDDSYSEGFENGKQWHSERSYSDMEEYADYCLMCSAEKTLKIPLPPKEWFEQFKKK